MEDATKPQSNREWMIHLSGQIDNLSKSINAFGERLVHIEETRLTVQDKRLSEIEQWILQMKGAWKLIVIIGSILSVALGWIIAWQLKHT